MVDCRCRLSKEGAWALAQSGNGADERSGEKGSRQETAMLDKDGKMLICIQQRRRDKREYSGLQQDMQIHYFTLPLYISLLISHTYSFTGLHLLLCQLCWLKPSGWSVIRLLRVNYKQLIISTFEIRLKIVFFYFFILQSI